MKKAFLYAFAAVVLGVSVMLFPLWTFFRRYNEEGPIAVRNSVPTFIPMWASENWEYYYGLSQAGDVPTYGDKIPPPTQIRVQTQAIDASLQILVIGFITAMVVYVVVRRRVPRQASTYRFPPI